MSWAMAGEASNVSASLGSDGRKTWKAKWLVTPRKTSRVVSPVPPVNPVANFTVSEYVSRFSAGHTFLYSPVHEKGAAPDRGTGPGRWGRQW